MLKEHYVCNSFTQFYKLQAIQNSVAHGQLSIFILPSIWIFF